MQIYIAGPLFPITSARVTTTFCYWPLELVCRASNLNLAFQTEPGKRPGGDTSVPVMREGSVLSFALGNFLE